MWVLVIEDEPAMGELLRRSLEEDKHTVTLTHDGLEGLHAAETCEIDVIVLDLMLPGLDGVEVARRLRLGGRHMPILVLTARDAPADIVKGLDAGADDYLTKPFSLSVLLARLRALSRRVARSAVHALCLRDLVLDTATHEARRADRLLDLTATEYRLLEFLLRRIGRACSRAAIIDGVWGLDRDVSSNALEAFVSQLRGKLNDAGPPLIETIRGYGYVLRDLP